ncbi:MAG: hypothetical protein JW795_06290 [Chitinivibrionales bacterium]|nr:hypothetical protein [Chitinivibrionales bacterium]
MSNLKKVLKKYSRSTESFGTSSLPINTKQLTSELLTLRRTTTMGFAFYVLMVLLLLILQVVLLILFLKNPVLLKTLFSIMGVSIAGLIAIIGTSIKTLANINLIYALSSELTAESIPGIIHALIKKI